MKKPIIDIVQLGFPWVGLDPFIMTVHHVEDYPAGNDRLGPALPLTGRNIGSDFSYQDGWSMYHGDRVPGFPRHPRIPATPPILPTPPRVRYPEPHRTVHRLHR